ncbi:hypothetical protein SERLA73DRAFT_68108 [Serpula lacrymans var. lacrymans S7.3]|uniref:DDE Tnp4 domain-containing protein n=2 Tax=Serpula lacrymans var. lacrymans TaxID=341189 RepID=F8PGZ0_SERL3|nr:uncharacterized protein SERLADRAFT_431837 [Serpula lacrymans var. lacrymans S7.9]EGO04427.1 hypothetical protein SERLA73DRAFT_68108 [Serpula lacrymans var. lacrymans S7.3]EGO30323.1 hypothetical protein SERLADRAFT_431837 [Serpula lacrymans var. lacrymans S7.9]
MLVLLTTSAFHDTHIYNKHQTLFGPNEWIWADSAYPSEKWCVVPFKKPPGGQITHNQKVFNYHLSKISVCTEHTFAALREHFQSLKNLRINNNDTNEHRFAMAWIKCCLILHNMIIDIEEKRGENTANWALEEGLEEISDEEEDLEMTEDKGIPAFDNSLSHGQNFCDSLMDPILRALARAPA